MGHILFIVLSFTTITLISLAIFMTVFRSSLALERRVQTFFPSSSLHINLKGQGEKDFSMQAKEKAKSIVQKMMKESSKISLEKRLEEAGRPNGWTAVDFRLMQGTLSLALLFGSLVLFLPAASSIASLLFMVMIFSFLGVYVPNFMLSVKIKKRTKMMEKMMPDFFDLLNLSMEAGMGLDASFNKVAKTLKGPLSDEFIKMMEDMKLGKSRKEAYMLLRERVKIVSFQQAITSLIQADQLGMGLSKTVSLLTSRIREQRVFTAREHAMKAPVKMVFPLLFLVFPAIFIVLLGPMVIYIVQSGL